MKRTIGVNSNCYHGYSVEDALEGIAAAGFHQGVDRACGPKPDI